MCLKYFNIAEKIMKEHAQFLEEEEEMLSDRIAKRNLRKDRERIHNEIPTWAENEFGFEEVDEKPMDEEEEVV